jgi:hypothetical protein
VPCSSAIALPNFFSSPQTKIPITKYFLVIKSLGNQVIQ